MLDGAGREIVLNGFCFLRSGARTVWKTGEKKEMAKKRAEEKLDASSASVLWLVYGKYEHARL